jgi:hypothetical protein
MIGSNSLKIEHMKDLMWDLNWIALKEKHVPIAGKPFNDFPEGIIPVYLNDVQIGTAERKPKQYAMLRLNVTVPDEFDLDDRLPDYETKHLGLDRYTISKIIYKR